MLLKKLVERMPLEFIESQSLPEVKPSNSVLKVIPNENTPDNGTKLGDTNITPITKRIKELPKFEPSNYEFPKEKKSNFWKVYAITITLIFLLIAGGIIYLIYNGKLTPTLNLTTNSTAEINNQYDFNPSISTPIENKFYNNFTTPKMEVICNCGNNS
jgi:hypothetical protein